MEASEIRRARRKADRHGFRLKVREGQVQILDRTTGTLMATGLDLAGVEHWLRWP